MIDDENFYSISKAFNELVNINNCRIVNASKTYRNATI